MDNLETQIRDAYGETVETRTLELRASTDDMVLEGYAARFNEVTDLGFFREQIAPGAFDDVIEDDVRFLLNHKGMPMARTSNGTLQLEVREEGLYARASLNETQQSRDVYAAVKRGDISQMSFAFTIGEDELDTELNTRTVTRVKKMFDVSAVSFPAYPTTTVQARDAFAAKKQPAPEPEPTPEPTPEPQPEERQTAKTERPIFDTKPQTPMTLNDLKGQRAAYYEEFVEIGKLADEEGRAMTEAEQERADRLDDLVQATDAKIKHKVREAEMVKRVAYTAPASTTESDEVRTINNRWSLSNAVRSLSNGQRLEGAEAEWTTEARREYRDSGISMAGEIGIPGFALLRSAADKFTASGAAAGGTASDGSGFVATDVPAAIAALRAPSVIETLGAQVIQAQGNLKFPRVSTAGTATIATEVADIDSAGMEMDEVTMTPLRAGSNSRYSKQLLIQGGQTVDAVIANDMRQSLQERVDKKGFAVILADSSVNDTTTTGASAYTVADGSALVGMEAAVLADGGDLNGASYVFSPKAYELFKTAAQVSNVSGAFDNGRFNGYDFRATPHLANASAALGKAIFGNFRQGLILAYFGGIDILVDPFSYAQTAEIQLHATRYFDVAVRQPGALCINEDISATAS